MPNEQPEKFNLKSAARTIIARQVARLEKELAEAREAMKELEA